MELSPCKLELCQIRSIIFGMTSVRYRIPITPQIVTLEQMAESPSIVFGPRCTIEFSKENAMTWYKVGI